MANLPSDVIFEIVSRTSLKALDKCKTVSKDWNQLVYSSNFMPAYCKNTNTTSGFYIQYPLSSSGYRSHKYVSLESEKELGFGKLANGDFKILASSMQGLLYGESHRIPQGLLYGESQGNPRCCVCKPCTNQWQDLPNPKLRYETVKVALIVLRSEPLRYKIVRLSKGVRPKHYSTKYPNSYKCEIFDSETWKWEMSANDVVLGNDEFFNPKTECAEVSGLIYCLTGHHVIAFDPTDEALSRFPLPESSGLFNPSLIEYEGKLGLINTTREGDAKFWVVDDSRTQSWRFVKEFKASLFETRYDMLKGFYNRDIALLESNNKMVFYNMQNSSIKEAVNVGLSYKSDYQIFPFRSDSELVNLKPV